MQVRIHKLARATPVVRQEIKESKLSCKALASKYKLTLKTIYKWKRRESTQDKSHTRHNLLSRVSEGEEAILHLSRLKCILRLFKYLKYLIQPGPYGRIYN